MVDDLKSALYKNAHLVSMPSETKERTKSRAIAFPESLLSALTAQARAERRTVANLVRLASERYLATHGDTSHRIGHSQLQREPARS